MPQKNIPKPWTSISHARPRRTPRWSATPELLAIAQRLVEWDLDYPVNCQVGYSGLKALTEIIYDAKAAIAKAHTSIQP